MKKFAKLTVFALICALLVVCLAIAPSAAKLTDIDNHWAKEYIEYGVEKGYISGYPDGTFLPNKTVTRAEFSKMLNSAVKITAKADADFKDVKAGEWYTEEVQKAVYAAYTTGYDDSTFRPNGNITRQEAAVFLSRVTLPITERANLNEFNDSKDIDSWAQDAVSMIAAKGYIKGDEEGRFLPKGQLTRSQAAKLIAEFVQNENIVNNDKTVDKQITLSETLFTDDVIVNTKEAADIIFENCRVLGTVSILSEDTNVELENTGVNTLENKSGEGVTVLADDDSLIKVANIYYPITLNCSEIGEVYLSGDDLSGEIVMISGNIDYIDVATGVILKLGGKVEKMNLSKKVNLVIQQGKINELVVSKNAKDSTINLSTAKVVVTNATNNAAVSYIGAGVIENANNVVTGVEYENPPENVTGKDAPEDTKKEEDDEDEDEDETNSSTFFSSSNVTFSPTAKKTKVAVDTKIYVTFKFDIKNKSKKAISSTYIEDNVELRKGSATGSQVDFSATFTSSSNKIMIVPEEDLKGNTKYYLVFPEGIFTDEDGKKNPKYSSYYFTTASSDDDEEDDEEEDDSGVSVTFSPANNDDDVKVDAQLKITFSQAIYTSAGKKISEDNDNESYLEKTAIELRKEKTTGEEVDFTATINSTSKIVTIKPDEELEEGTVYYLIILGSKLENSKGTAISKKSIKFTTSGESESGAEVTVTPAAGSKNISSMPDITVDFGEVMYREDKDEVPNASYFENYVFELHLTSKTGTEVGLEVISKTDKKVVLNPTEELAAGKTYYLVIKKETLKSKNTGDYNKEIATSFTVAGAMAPMVTPMNGATGIETSNPTIEVMFSSEIYTIKAKNDNVFEAVDDDYLAENKPVTLRKKSSTGAEVACTYTIEADGRTITITPEEDLATNYTYCVVVTAGMFTDSTGKTKNTAITTTFKTVKEFIPEFTPKDGAEGVECDATLKVDFGESLYDIDGKTISKNYLVENVIELYKGSVDADNAVKFSAAISTNKEYISITPVDEFESDTEYVLVLKPNTLTNADGEKNPGDTITFTTNDDVNTDVKIDPSATTNVSIYTEPTIKFQSPVFVYETGETIDEEYAKEAIILYEGKKAEDYKVPEISISIDNDRNFTIYGYELLPKTTYYITILANKFEYANGKAVAAKSFTFKTIENMPEIEIVSEAADETTYEVKFNTNLAGKVTLRVVPAAGGSAKTATKTYSKKATGETLKVTGLTAGTEYDVTLTFVASSIEVAEISSFETESAEPACEICGEPGHEADDHCSVCESLEHAADAHCSECDSLEHDADAHCSECGSLEHETDACPELDTGDGDGNGDGNGGEPQGE